MAYRTNDCHLFTSAYNEPAFILTAQTAVVLIQQINSIKYLFYISIKYEIGNKIRRNLYDGCWISNKKNISPILKCSQPDQEVILKNLTFAQLVWFWKDKEVDRTERFLVTRLVD